jgi:hypothetical protein
VGGQQHEAVIDGDRAARFEERRQIGLDAPGPTAVAVSVRGRVQDDPVVATAPARLASDEGGRIVDEPADGAIGEAVAMGILAGPADGRPRGIDVGDGRSGAGHGQGRQPRGGEQMEDGRRVDGGARTPRDLLGQPSQRPDVLREQPDLPGLGRAQAQLQIGDPDRPRVEADLRPGLPATVAVEAQIGLAPGRVRASRTQDAGGGTVGHSRPEPLETSPVADIEERVVVHGPIFPETGAHHAPYRRP